MSLAERLQQEQEKQGQQRCSVCDTLAALDVAELALYHQTDDWPNQAARARVLGVQESTFREHVRKGHVEPR